MSAYATVMERINKDFTGSPAFAEDDGRGVNVCPKWCFIDDLQYKPKKLEMRN